MSNLVIVKDVKRLVTYIRDILDQDNKGVQIGCYSVALIGLTVAVNRVRPFTKLVKPNDLPRRFIKDKRELRGIVQRIDPNGCMLMISHKPLIPIPFTGTGELPVKICGVKIGGNGFSWLQTIVTGQRVVFIPILQDNKCVHCEVVAPKYVNHSKKQATMNLGETLVKIGFAQVTSSPSFRAGTSISSTPGTAPPGYLKYRNKLLFAENYALRKQMGFWYYVKFVQSFLVTLSTNTARLMGRYIQQSSRSGQQSLQKLLT